MTNKRSSNKGITLIALVVTVIALLILDGIGITMLTEENSIAKKAIQSKDATSEAEAKERVQIEVLGSFDTNGNINKEKLKENIRNNLGIQDNQIIDPNEDEEFKEPVDFPLGDYDVRVNPNGDVKIMPKGEISTPPTLEDGIPEDTSYVGYYADLDGDISTAEGIIYVDQGEARSGRWNSDDWSDYSYSKGSNLKKYKVSTNNVSGFGSWSKPIVSEIPGTRGNDRFYIMALNDFDSNTHYWYESACFNLDNPVATNENDFGRGKINTTTEIANWTSEHYGTRNDNDMWGVIKDNLTKYGKTWFVASRVEWAAFGDMCWTQIKMDKNTYPNFGLSRIYWSSAQHDTFHAYTADFYDGYMSNDYVSDSNFVRLSTTF